MKLGTGKHEMRGQGWNWIGVPRADRSIPIVERNPVHVIVHAKEPWQGAQLL